MDTLNKEQFWSDNSYYRINMNKNYHMEFLFFPGRFLNSIEIDKLIIMMREFDNQNKKSKIGILDEDCNEKIIEDFFSNSIMTFFSKNGELKGFSLYYILSENPLIVHLGFVYSARKKEDPHWVLASEVFRLSKLYENNRQSFFCTSLTKIPWIIATMPKFAKDIWPNPYKPHQKKINPNLYNNIAQLCYERYLKTIRKNRFSINMEKFIIVDNEKSNLENNFNKLKKINNTKINNNIRKLISYDNKKQNEKLLQIGKFSLSSYIKAKIIIFKMNIRFNYTTYSIDLNKYTEKKENDNKTILDLLRNKIKSDE